MPRTKIDIDLPDLSGKRVVVTGASDGAPRRCRSARRAASQISVAARRGSITWGDLNGERSYHVMRAYSQSKIEFGVFGLELQRRSAAHGWGITSNLSHPGVAPTSLLAARPEIGRGESIPQYRIIQGLSSRGILLGSVETAALPALMAATDPSAKGGVLYGPSGPGDLGGRPAEQRLYASLRSTEDAARVWEVSERLTGVSIEVTA